jgi:hypothetical protein
VSFADDFCPTAAPQRDQWYAFSRPFSFAILALIFNFGSYPILAILAISSASFAVKNS